MFKNELKAFETITGKKELPSSEKKSDRKLYMKNVLVSPL